MALELFNLYMEDVQRIDNDDGALTELCLDADFALSRIERSERKYLASSHSIEDKTLCQSIGSAHSEVARLFDRLDRSFDAKKSARKAKKWGYVQGNNIIRQEPSQPDNSIKDSSSSISSTNGNSNISNSIININNNSNNDNTALALKRMIRAARIGATQSIAVVSTDIFGQDEARVVKYSLPLPDASLDDIYHLAYCLCLLRTANQPQNEITVQEQEWSLATLNDQDELDRLHNLASDVVTTFIRDDIKTESAVAEVVMLAPALDRKCSLMALINRINESAMLEAHLLQGLARLMQHTSPGYLESDDLENILNALSSHLQSMHAQTGDHIYRLCMTISSVLDAMVNSQVEGLKRVQLHEPLAAYLKGLKDSSDPHLVYYAAYAYQALLHISNDETPMQAMLWRTPAVIRGFPGGQSAIKELDQNTFMNELINIQKELPPATNASNMCRRFFNRVASLWRGGETFKQCVEEGLSFSRMCAWYPALRGADMLLQRGAVIKFKALVCEVPCRRDPAFQWGLCQRLGQIAANTQWAMKTRQNAIAFLGEMYKNDKDWGHHVEIKRWIVAILEKLILSSKDGLRARHHRH
ncbi:hypothetical protein BX616_004206 [Lobosporangium transversale]|nr:hypothetical protein BX616_004206 [Lobosporangium transversale]